MKLQWEMAVPDYCKCGRELQMQSMDWDVDNAFYKGPDRVEMACPLRRFWNFWRHSAPVWVKPEGPPKILVFPRKEGGA